MAEHTTTIRRRLDLRGQVQGVGFRPFVYRLAALHSLAGHVGNNSNGAVIEVEGPPEAINAFQHDLTTCLPPLARITDLHQQNLAPVGETAFRIRPSDDDAARRPEVTPDAATCADCRRELLDPADRRYRYPFINCTNCGPRYSIIKDVPYDRPLTTMAVFQMCADCAREYRDPADRRFHAQPNACPVCGPQYTLVSTSDEGHTIQPASLPGRGRGEGSSLNPQSSILDPASSRLPQCAPPSPIAHAAALLQSGAIVAVKGIGGFHLACRADDDAEEVVRRLRERKLRDGKPLAVMVPDLATARRLCRLTPADEEALTSVAAPIVLARNAGKNLLAPSVAPDCQDFGLMLPYAPVHHLLFAEGLGPLVMTSANLAGQPLTYRDEDALAGLSDVADAFLIHNREIHRPIDDSVVFTFRDEVVPVRRARGYAPQPIRLTLPAAVAGGAGGRAPRVLAVGGELKSTVCLLDGHEAVLSEHLGDLTQPETYRAFVRALERLSQLFAFTPEVVACDLHPLYLATSYARRLGLPTVAVQHHHAHSASVMAEWGEPGPVVGLACDGTGLGTDRAVWGGEILVCQGGTFERAGHLEYFPLVGGDAAAIETWRPAAALLRAAYGDEWTSVLRGLCGSGRGPTPNELRIFERQAADGLNAPLTSSLGRVFDAVSFVLGLCDRNRHEAEAAMTLEAAASGEPLDVEPLAYELRAEDGVLRLSYVATVRALIDGRRRGQAGSLLAARFHETIARSLAEAAVRVCDERGLGTVALSGGCFANRRLLGRAVDLLEAAGRRVLYHRRVPSGDGGLALGQALVAAWQTAAEHLDMTNGCP